MCVYCVYLLGIHKYTRMYIFKKNMLYLYITYIYKYKLYEYTYAFKYVNI